MKRCPACRRDYFDDTLLFCLDDGVQLLDGPSSVEPKTILFPDPVSQHKSVFPGEDAAIPRLAPLPKLSQLTFSDSIEEYPAWSPNGEEFAFSRDESGIRSIFIKDLATGDERRLTTGSYDDIQAAWTPDGKKILFVRARLPNVRLEPGDVFGLFIDGDIWAVDLETAAETKMIERAFNPDCSPDGERIAFDGSWARAASYLGG